MALELNRLTNQVNVMGEAVARRLAELNGRLPGARDMLLAIGVAGDELHRKVRAALALRWAGAIPTGEPVGAVYGLPPMPNPCTVLAADGSQIYPDRHGVALYYLINIGGIVFRCGGGAAPATRTWPQVFFDDADLYLSEGGQKPPALIDAERDRRELAALADLAGHEAQAVPAIPRVALLDNGLLLYLSLQIDNPRLIKDALEGYLDQLDRLRDADAVVAGVVDRPRAASVVRLLHLNALPLEEIREETLRRLGPFEGLTDAMLFDELEPGQRSALFVHASPNNEIYYVPRGHSIYFFYLNTGRPGSSELLRVEVPEWVAGDPARLDLVHAALVDQSRVSGGFPYVLMRAHELAVVTAAERREFDQMVTGALMRQRLRPGISQKAQGKAWTGGPRRRFPR